MGLRAGLDTVVKRKNPLSLPGIEPRSSGRPVRSQTLYCLRYPGSYTVNKITEFITEKTVRTLYFLSRYQTLPEDRLD
jgi:hypothetical protein